MEPGPPPDATDRYVLAGTRVGLGTGLHVPRVPGTSTAGPTTNQAEHGPPWWSSSGRTDALLDRFHENMHLRGMKGELPLPADGLPTRNERLGWTGDIQVFAQTAKAA